jgi:hypothetical protein
MKYRRNWMWHHCLNCEMNYGYSFMARPWGVILGSHKCPNCIKIERYIFQSNDADELIPTIEELIV